DAQLALVDLGLGRAADAQHSHAAGELREALLELLAVPVRVGVLDVPTQLGATLGHGVLGAAAIDDDGLVLRDGDAARGAHVVQGDGGQLPPELLVDDGGAGDDGQVIHERLAAVTEVRGLHAHDLQGLADGVDHQHLQGLALDVFGDDQYFLAGLGDLLQDWQEVRQAGDLLADQQDQRVLQDGLTGVSVGDEVRGQEALVEGQAFGDGGFVLEGLGLLDGDHAVASDLLEGVGDHLADGLVAGGDGSDVGDRSGVGNLLRALLQQLHDLLGGGGDAAVQRDRVSAGGDVAQALVDERLGQQGGGGGAVACDVVGLDGDGLHQLRTEVLEGVFEVDVAGDGHAVVGDQWATEGTVQHDVAAARAERHLHRVSERVDTLLEALAGFLIKCDEFGHALLAYFSMTARMSRWLSSRYSWPSYFSSVPPNLEKMTVSPSLTSIGMRSSSSAQRPGPTATTVASCGFSCAESGITRPDAVVVSASTIWTRTRSSSGLMLTLATLNTSVYSSRFSLCPVLWGLVFLCRFVFRAQPSSRVNNCVSNNLTSTLPTQVLSLNSAG